MISGKSLFIRNLLVSTKYYEINCRNPKVFEDTFHWQMSSKDKDTEVLWFHDINKKADMCFFISLTGLIRVNPKIEKVFYINPRLVLEFSEEIKNFPKDASFIRRFHIINTNTITYRDLVSFLIKWNKKEL